MADDDNNKKGDKAEETALKAADEAEKSEEKAEDAAKQAEQSANTAESAAKEVKEVAQEVKEDKKDSASEVPLPSVASAKDGAKKPMPKVSKKLEDLISEIEKLSVLELSELVKALEAKFGVSAAPVAVAAAGTAPAGSSDEGTSEQTTFNVFLTDGGANKISTIKAVRELVPTLGLKEAKDLVDGEPKQVLEGVNKENAQEAKTKLEAAGAKVELK